MCSHPIKQRASRKKQYDETDCEEANLEDEKAFEVNYFLIMVDMEIRSLESRFEELQSFKKYIWVFDEYNYLEVIG